MTNLDLRKKNGEGRRAFRAHSPLRFRSRLLLSGLAAAVLVFSAPDAFACSVCFGAPGDPMVKGVNNGIWLLLGFVAFVQVGFIAMFWSFWRRAKAQRRLREQFHVIEGGQRS